jgi:branched-chain amino acid transport system permease protein
MSYLAHLIVWGGIYVSLAMSLNIVAGQLGRMSLAHCAFFGLGAYGTALLSTKFPLGIWQSALLAIIVAGLVARLVGAASLHLAGDYFVIATLALQSVATSLAYNWHQVTGGSSGITAIPPLEIYGVSFARPERAAVLTAILAASVIWIAHRLRYSDFGRLLAAIRDNELAARAMGKDVDGAKIAAFVVAACLAAATGALYAGYVRFVDPTSFTLGDSIMVLAAIILGGSGRFVGPIIGAVALVVLPEALKQVHISDNVAANLRQVIFGLLLIVVVLRHSASVKIGRVVKNSPE